MAEKDGKTALIWAAARGKQRSVRLLLESGADLDHRDKTGRRAREWAQVCGPPARPLPPSPLSARFFFSLSLLNYFFFFGLSRFFV